MVACVHINNSDKPLYLLNYLYYELFTCVECTVAAWQTRLGVNESCGFDSRVVFKLYKFLKCIFVHKRAKGSFPPPPLSRTKWKRQTAVGLELLAEAGNYSALQRMFPSPYFYPQSLVSNLDPGAALYLYRGPSAPPPTMQRPLVPRILLHGLQGGSEPPPPPPPLAPMSGVLPRPAQQR